MNKGINYTNPEEIPEVREYLETVETIEVFRREHKKVFEQYDELIEQHNQRLEAADKTVRAREISSGPFVRTREQPIYDAKAFYDAVGQDKFLNHGGRINTVVQYEIDKEKVGRDIAAGKIDPHVVDIFRTLRPYYKTPKPLA